MTNAIGMTRDEIFDVVRKVLVDLFDIEDGAINRDFRFVDGDRDEWDLIEVLSWIEERLSKGSRTFEFSDEEAAEIDTVGDAVDTIFEKLNE